MAAGRGQELPASPPLASRRQKHPGRAGLDLPEPPTSPAKATPYTSRSNPACLLDVWGPPLSPRSRRFPKPGSSFLWMNPTGWSPSQGLASTSQAGCRQAGTETASPCPALALSCLVGGREQGKLERVAPRDCAGAMLIYTSPGCNANRHSSGGRVGLGGSQQGSVHGAQRGSPALFPTLWASSRMVSAD